MAVELATAYVSLLPSTSKLAPGVRSALDRTMPKEGRRGGSKLGGFLAGAVKKAAKGGMIAAGVAVGGALLDGVRSAVNIQQSKKTLAGLYGSVTEANSALALLRKTASTSPIDYSAFAKGAEQLAYMGYKGKDANAILKNTAKAIVTVGGSSEDMGRVTTAMLQMQNSGKVYADQLNQISQAGVPIFSGLAAHFKTNISNVRDMVTKGKVSMEDVLAVVQNAEGKTFKQMIAASDSASKSLSNQWKVTRDNLRTYLGFAFQPGIDKLGELLAAANKAPGTLKRLFTAGSTFKSAPIQAISDSLVTLREAARSVGASLKTMGVALLPLAKGGATVAIGALVLAFKALAQAGRVVSDVMFSVSSFADEHPKAFRRIAAAVLITIGAWKAYKLTVAGVTAVQKAMAAQTLTTRVGLAALRAQDIASAIASRTHAVATTTSRVAMSLWGKAAVGARVQAAAFRVQTVAMAAAQRAQAVATTLGNTAMRGWQALALGTRIQLAALRVQTIAIAVAQRAAGIASRVWAAGQWLLNAAMSANPVGAVIALVIALVAAIVIAYRRSSTFRAIVQGAFKGIQVAGLFMWNNVLKPVLKALGVGLRVAGAVASWLWRKAIAPAFKGIGLVVRTQVAIGKAVLRALGTALRVAGSAATWLYRKAIAPAFRGIGLIVRTQVSAVRTVLSALSNFVRHTVPAAFRSAVSSIRAAWHKVESAAKTPVNFMIGTVYGKGIKGLFDKVAGAVGSKIRLPHVPLLASGTESLTKASKAGWRRKPTAIVGEGSRVHPESVIPTDPKHRGRALQLWQQTGQRLGMPMMAEGGFLGALKSKVSKLIETVSDPVGAFKKMAATPIAWMNRFAGNDFGRLVAAVPRKMLDLIVAKVKTILGGSGNTAAIIRAAKQANGSPYVWGGASLSGSDCSGFQSILYRAGLGKKPLGQREFTTATFGGGRNVGQFKRSLANSSPYRVSVNPGSHIWGKVRGSDGKWYAVESGGSWGKVHFGPASGIRGGGQYHYGLQFKGMARGGQLDRSMYPFPLEGMPEPMLRRVLKAQAARIPVYDNGGYLQPGPMNRTKKPEPVLTRSQWQDVQAYLPVASDRTSPTTRSAPLVDTVNIHEASNSQQVVNDLAFTLRHIGRGGRYAATGR